MTGDFPSQDADPIARWSSPLPVLAKGDDYPAGHWVLPHRHRRGQLLLGIRGVVLVATEHGRWVVPPERAVWIPAGVLHDVRMLGPVTLRSIYVAEGAVADLPAACRVVGVSPLLRALMVEAALLPADDAPSARAGLIMALLLQELRIMPELPLALPFPKDVQLARRCRRFLEQPTPHDRIEDWSRQLGMSRRAFTRRFRDETGVSLSMWRRQACLFAALPRLAAGEPVTSIALDLGYESAAAFSTMFRRLLGVPPNRWLQAARGAPIERLDRKPAPA